MMALEKTPPIPPRGGRWWRKLMLNLGACVIEKYGAALRKDSKVCGRMNWLVARSVYAS